MIYCARSDDLPFQKVRSTVLKDKKDVYKPPAVIHHDNTKVSLLQKKAWSWLIANAYDELPTEEIHQVGVHELMQVMGYNSHDQEHLKESLRGLMGTVIEWDIPRYDKKNVWQAATMLAGVRIEENACFYSFEPMFRRALHHPEVYARLSLQIINQFSGKYALNLWEMCMHAMNPKTGAGETRWWEIDEFRKIIGVKEGTYKGDFYELNKRVIKPSIKEIKLLARCEVTPEYKRNRRKYTHVRFKAVRIKALEGDSKQAELFIDTEGLPEMAAELVKAGIHRNKALKIWGGGFRDVKANNKPQGNFEDYLWEKIDLLKVQSTKEKIANRGAWLVSAIENNYQHPTYQNQKRVERTRKQIGELEAEVKKIKEEQGTREFEILEPLLDTDEMLQKAFQQLKESPLFDESLNKYADNIREGLKEGGWFAAGIRLVIKDAHAGKFDELNEYQEHIEKVESQIMQLKVKLRG